MTQQEFNEKVKLLEDQIKKSQAVLEELKAVKIENNQQKRWRPIYDDRYWVVDCNGDITRKHWYDDDTDKWLYITGNYFQTAEEAEEYKKQLEYTALYKNYIEEHSEPIDWNDGFQDKWSAFFDFSENVISINQVTISKYQGEIHATSKQIIQDAIHDIGEDNFKKYVLGVE